MALTRAQMEAAGNIYIGTQAKLTAARKAGQTVVQEGPNWFIKGTAAPLPVKPATPVPDIPTPTTAVPAPTPTGGTTPIAPSTLTETTPTVTPATSPALRHVGPDEWNVLRKKYGMTPANESQYVVRNPTGMPSGIYVKPEFDPKLSRASLESGGYKYLGTMDAVQAAKRAGKDVKVFNGSYYVVPAKTTGTSDAVRNDLNNTVLPPDPASQSPVNTNPVGSGPINIPGLGNISEDDVPDAPDLVATYRSMRASENMDKLEEDINSINDGIRQLDASYNAGVDEIGNEMKPMSIIQGDRELLRQQYARQRDLKTNELAVKSDILATKTKSIDMLMDFTKEDYTNARQAFNDKFQRAVDTQRLWNEGQNLEINKATLQNSIENQKRDDARANLSVITDGMAANNVSYESLTPTQRANIATLELKAGLPAGTIGAFVTSKPGSKILATVNGTDKNGNDIVSFVYADKNGKPGVVETRRTGGYTRQSSGGGGGGGSTRAVKLTSKNTLKVNDGKGGFSFKMSDGTSITAGQYAAAHKTTLGAALSEEKSTTIADMNSKLLQYRDAGYSLSSTRSDFQTNKPHLFGGLSDAEFKQVTGYTELSEAQKKALQK